MHKIAVIDSHESVRQSIEKLLSEAYQVYVFDTVAEFTQTIKHPQPYDLILVELNLSKENNNELLQQLRRMDLPIIVMTNEQDIDAAANNFGNGEFDFIRKPINHNILQHRIKLHLLLRSEKNRVEQTQEQLVQNEKMAALGQLAAGVAHEINNPIGFVTSNTNLVGKYVFKLQQALQAFEQSCHDEATGAALLLYTSWRAQSNIDKILTDLGEISEESIDGLNRVKEIVKDLKEYAHVGEQKFENADINKLLNSTVNLLRNEIKYKAEVSFEFEELPLIPVIISQMNQVFVNIVINACHAIEEFGQITITTHLDDRFAYIDISDSGSGMPKAVINKIFDPFFTTKAIGKGTGIGLAISKSIIDRHHAILSVNSVEGEGSTFTIKLPLEQPAEATTAE